MPPPYPADTQPDTPWAVWVPATPANFEYADSAAPMRQIDYVVIHDIEGSAKGTLQWFRNPQARATSHYVLDGGTGIVYQMVKERDIAWHAGNSDINHRSVGIEHQGYAYRPGYYDPREYETSARLVRDITARYHIPHDRQHIFGHSEVPDPNNPNEFGGRSHHRDPGPYWDWDYFMTLVRNDANLTVPAPSMPTLHPGEKATVTISATNTGDDPWPSRPRAGGMDANGIALAASNPVYLGLWPMPATLPETSPLRDVSWTSPRLVGLPDGGVDVAAGGSGTFTVTLAAPPVEKAGQITASFRLIQMPPAPHPPVGFGPILPLTVNVEPWEITAGGASGFTPGAGWHLGNGGVSWIKNMPGATLTPAQWKTDLPLGGQWDVYAHWEGAAGRTPKATYSIETADGVKTVTVDQRQKSWATGNWHLLGRFRFVSPPSVKGPQAPVVVRVTADAPGVAVADTVRFAGPFPAAADVPDLAGDPTPQRFRQPAPK